jgi:hypothetical protein
MGQKHFMRLGLTTLSFILLTACGAKKTSFTGGRGNTDLPSSGSYLMGECSRVNLASPQTKGTIGTYYDPASRMYVASMINLNLTTVPAEIFTSDTHQIQFFRWSDSGTRVTNQIPVRFYFVDKLTGAVAPQSNTVDRISKATLTAAKTTFGALWSNITLAQFFERAQIVLTGMEYQFHGMSMAYYNTSVGSGAIGIADVLLPPFYANPNVYRTYHPQPGLYSLHPNYALSGANATESDYWRMIEDICRDLAGLDTRIPASVDSSTSPAEKSTAKTWPAADRKPMSVGENPGVIRKIWLRIVESL